MASPKMENTNSSAKSPAFPINITQVMSGEADEYQLQQELSLKLPAGESPQEKLAGGMPSVYSSHVSPQSSMKLI